MGDLIFSSVYKLLMEEGIVFFEMCFFNLEIYLKLMFNKRNLVNFILKWL